MTEHDDRWTSVTAVYCMSARDGKIPCKVQHHGERNKHGHTLQSTDMFDIDELDFRPEGPKMFALENLTKPGKKYRFHMSESQSQGFGECELDGGTLVCTREVR